MRTLRIISGPAAGQTIPIDQETVIGREAPGFSVDDPEMSRMHAALRPVDAGVEVEDLGSTNGTFVDGTRLEEKVTVAGSARLKLGTSEMELEVEVPAAAEPEEEPETEPIPPEPETEPMKPEAAVPDVTAPRAIPAEPDVTAPRAIPPEPDVTAPRAIPQEPDVTAPRAIPAEPDVTAPRAIPAEPDVTAQRSVPAPPGPPETGGPPGGGPPGGPPGRGAPVKRPPTPVIIGVAVLFAAAILAFFFLTGGDDKERHELRAVLSLNSVGDNVLAGTTRGEPAGPGSVRVDLDFGGTPLAEITDRTRGTVKITSRYDDGSFLTEVQATASPVPDGGVRFVGSGLVSSGTGDFDGAEGVVELVGNQPGQGSGRFNLTGFIEYSG